MYHNMVIESKRRRRWVSIACAGVRRHLVKRQMTEKVASLSRSPKILNVGHSYSCSSWATSTKLQNYGKSIEQSMNSWRIELATIVDSQNTQSHRMLSQGFQVSDEEINMDLQRFRDSYANSTGVVEWVKTTAYEALNCLPALHLQSTTIEFLHYVAIKSNRPNFCVLLRWEKRRR